MLLLLFMYILNNDKPGFKPSVNPFPFDIERIVAKDGKLLWVISMVGNDDPGEDDEGDEEAAEEEDEDVSYY